MTLLCGVDGCRAGWFAITHDLDTGAIAWRVYPHAHDLFQQHPQPDVWALDIPMGLPEAEARACDREARRQLGRGRASSVFPAPLRGMLAATTYAEACAFGLRQAGKKLSRQTWAILPKIRQVDAALRQEPTLPKRVYEVHPELSFQVLAGQPLRHSKHHPAGRAERQRLLEPVFGPHLTATLAVRAARQGFAADDVLDACAALWTAQRIAQGQALTLPADPVCDVCGLRMAITV